MQKIKSTDKIRVEIKYVKIHCCLVVVYKMLFKF